MTDELMSMVRERIDSESHDIEVYKKMMDMADHPLHGIIHDIIVDEKAHKRYLEDMIM